MSENLNVSEVDSVPESVFRFFLGKRRKKVLHNILQNILNKFQLICSITKFADGWLMLSWTMNVKHIHQCKPHLSWIKNRRINFIVWLSLTWWSDRFKLAETKTAVTMKSVPPSAGRSLYCHMDGLLFSPRHVISCQYHLATRT